MPSKGVDYFSFIGIENTTIRFSGPKVGETTTKSDNFAKKHLEIDGKNTGPFNWTGKFQWDIIRDGKTIFSRQQEINWMTGNLGNGNLSPLMNTPAVIGPDYIITYGLYDAGPGLYGLPRSDQAWVTIIPNLSNWMGSLAPVGSPAANKPFSTYVLAAAHDAGMNTMAGISIVTSGASSGIFNQIAGRVLPSAAGLSSVHGGATIMLDLAMTQKESTTSLLSMGVRYFDFRPAYLVPGVRDVVSANDNTLYHTHLIVPGQRFDSFLTEIVSFLKSHPTEIVVVRTCADGIKVCEVPSHDVISQFARNATQGTGIALGDSNSFQRKISDLRASNTRLILVLDNPKYDSYSDGAYATLDPSTIIGNFSRMDTGGQSGGDYTVLQCQGTATGIMDVLIYAITTAGQSTSPLMGTKAYFDRVTLPWAQSNALSTFTAQKNIVLMNDFVDGATTFTGFQLSQSRFGTPAIGVGNLHPTGITVLPKAATIAAVASTPPPAQPAQAVPSLEAAQQAKVAAEKELEKLKVQHAALKAIVTSSNAIREEGKDVDERALRVHETAQKELAGTIEAQQEVIKIAEKRVAEAKAGNL